MQPPMWACFRVGGNQGRGERKCPFGEGLAKAVSVAFRKRHDPLVQMQCKAIAHPQDGWACTSFFGSYLWFCCHVPTPGSKPECSAFGGRRKPNRYRCQAWIALVVHESCELLRSSGLRRCWPTKAQRKADKPQQCGPEPGKMTVGLKGMINTSNIASPGPRGAHNG